MVLSGLAIYKPVQLHFLTLLFGGYDGARVVHLAGLLLLAIFLVTAPGAGLDASARNRQHDHRRPPWIG